MKKLLTIAGLFICACILSCNDRAEGESSTQGDTTKQIQDTTGTLDTTGLMQSLVPITKTDAQKYQRHYKHPDVDSNRIKAKHADLDVALFYTLFNSQSTDEVLSIRAYPAAFTSDYPETGKRNFPTLIIGIKTRAKDADKTDATLVKETYYIASGICPPPSPCRSDLD